jgi:enoyl-CoA hydratase
MEYKFIILNKNSGIAHIVLNRPEVLNALCRDMITELQHAVTTIREAEEVRVLVISGSGKNFAAGADIGPMADQTPDQARKFSFNKTFNDLEDLPIPVIAAISGYALGGGLELALACDIRICSEDAKLGLPEIKIGIFPGAGGTQRLPRLIGSGRAKEMIFTGNSVDAVTALSYGLCNKVIHGDPVNEAMDLAKVLCQRPTVAIAHSKNAINFGIGRDISSGTSYEAELWADLFSTSDQREGMKAFLEKRKPIFTGKREIIKV